MTHLMLEDKTDDGHYYEDGRKYSPTVRYVLPSDKGGNICKAIPSLKNTFGFAFQRLVFSTLTSEEWNRNLKELYRVLKPRGFVERLEHNLMCHNAGPLLTTLTGRIFQGFN
ncbi:hypothetical protein EDC94DRAFT_645688 [Helicostylum pulchrum]|nr:hypothetical protein EDC94DRAFT_645688 [Helicostylum pulchrum]